MSQSVRSISQLVASLFLFFSFYGELLNSLNSKVDEFINICPYGLDFLFLF